MSRRYGKDFTNNNIINHYNRKQIKEYYGACSVSDNKCTIVMDVKNSAEKVDTMRLLGAEVIQVRGKDRIIARQLKDENPDAVILNQVRTYT